MYGTSKTSYQNIADARICVKHSENINQELAGGRSQKIGSIYIESANGERFKYPYKHLNGARAMAMHVAEGGNMYDDFGKHIVGLSEEMNKLRKFKTYMSRSSVMAEGLADYMDVVNERIETVKNTVAKLQNKKYYKEATENFQSVVLEEVPEDVATDWTAQLTIKQFNEELKSVFPYIYKLVSEANKVKELGPEDLLGEELKDKEDYQAKKKALQDIQMDPNTHKDEKLKKKIGSKKMHTKPAIVNWRDEFDYVQEGAAWTKKSGKNPEGGLNEKGRKSYERENPGSDLKAPQPEGGSRKKSFCARMSGMKKKLTSAKTANDPDSRINKSLRKWKC